MATIQQQRELIALTALMFDAPPGAEYLEELSQLIDNGLSLNDIANELINSPLFNGQFSSSETERAKINHILENVGVSVNSPVYEEAYQFFADGLASGRSAAEMLVEAGEFLAATNDPRYAEAKATFVNKIEVGFFHSVTAERSSDSLDELQGVYTGVTSDPGTIDEATGRVNTFRLEADGSNANLTDVELADNFTRIDLNGQSALLNAEQAELVLLANGGSYSLQDSAEALLDLPESVLNGAVNITVTGATNVTQAVALNEIENSGSLSYGIEGSVNAIGTALRGDDSTDATREALANADAISVDGEITLNLNEYGLIGAALQTDHRIVDSADAVLAIDDETWETASSELLQAVVLNAAPSERLSVDEALTLETRVTDFAGFTYDLSVSLSDAYSNGLWSDFANVDNVLLNEELDTPLTISQALTLESRISDFVNSVEFSVTDTPANIQQALNQNSSAASSLLANAESIVTNANGNVVTVSQIVGWLDAGAQLETLQFDLQAGQGALGSLSVSAASLRLDIIAQADNSAFIPTSYSLSDTIENLLLQADANADVLTGASSVTATDDAGMTQIQQLLEAGVTLGGNFTYSLSINPNRGELSVDALEAEFAIIQAATNTDDVLPISYTLNDSVEALLALANSNATLLNDASSVTATGAATLAEVQQLLDAGVDLDDLTFTLEGGEQGELSIGQALSYQAILAAASSDVELADLTYTLNDAVATVLAELTDNVALLQNADQLTLSGNASIANIESLLDANIALTDLTFSLTGGDSLGDDLSLEDIAAIQAINEQADNDVFDTFNYTLTGTIENLVAAASSNTVALTQAVGITVEDAASVSQIQTLLDAGVALGDLTFSLGNDTLGTLSIVDAQDAQAIIDDAVTTGDITYAIADNRGNINDLVAAGDNNRLLEEAEAITVSGTLTRAQADALLTAANKQPADISADDISFELAAGQDSLGSVTVEVAIRQLAIIDLSTNRDVSDATYTLADNFAELSAEIAANAELLTNATGVVVNDAITLANVETLLAVDGIELADLTYSLEAGQQDITGTPLSVSDALAALDIIEAAQNFARSDAEYVLQDSIDTLLAAIDDNSALLSNADSIIVDDATVTLAQIQQLVDAGVDVDAVTFTLEDTIYALSVSQAQTALPIFGQDEGSDAGYRLTDTDVALAADLVGSQAKRDLLNGAVADVDNAAITISNAATVANVETIVTNTNAVPADLTYSLASGQQTLGTGLSVEDASLRISIVEQAQNSGTLGDITYGLSDTFESLQGTITDDVSLLLSNATGDIVITGASGSTTVSRANIETLLAVEGIELESLTFNLALGQDSLGTVSVEQAELALSIIDQSTNNDVANARYTLEDEVANFLEGGEPDVTVMALPAGNDPSFLASTYSLVVDADLLDNAEGVIITDLVSVGQVLALTAGSSVALADITYALDVDLFASENDYDGSVEEINAIMSVIQQATNADDIEAAFGYTLTDSAAQLTSEAGLALVEGAESITVEDSATRAQIESLITAQAELETITYTLGAGQGNLRAGIGENITVEQARLALEIIQQSSNTDATTLRLTLEDDYQNILDGLAGDDDLTALFLLASAEAIAISDAVTIADIQALLDGDAREDAGVPLATLSFSLDDELVYDFTDGGSGVPGGADEIIDVDSGLESEELEIALAADNVADLDITYTITDEKASIFTGAAGSLAFASTEVAALLNTATGLEITDGPLTLEEYRLLEGLNTFDMANLIDFSIEADDFSGTSLALDVTSESFNGADITVAEGNYNTFNLELNGAGGDDEFTVNFGAVAANTFNITGDLGDDSYSDSDSNGDRVTIEFADLEFENRANAHYTLENVEVLTFIFADEDDVLRLTSESSLAGVRELTVTNGTLDVSGLSNAADFDGIDNITINSSIIVTVSQLAELTGSITTNPETDSTVEILVNTEADMQALAAALDGKIGQDVKVNVAVDGTSEEFEAIKVALDEAMSSISGIDITFEKVNANGTREEIEFSPFDVRFDESTITFTGTNSGVITFAFTESSGAQQTTFTRFVDGDMVDSDVESNDAEEPIVGWLNGLTIKLGSNDTLIMTAEQWDTVYGNSIRTQFTGSGELRLVGLSIAQAQTLLPQFDDNGEEPSELTFSYTIEDTPGNIAAVADPYTLLLEAESIESVDEEDDSATLELTVAQFKAFGDLVGDDVNIDIVDDVSKLLEDAGDLSRARDVTAVVETDSLDLTQLTLNKNVYRIDLNDQEGVALTAVQAVSAVIKRGDDGMGSGTYIINDQLANILAFNKDEPFRTEVYGWKLANEVIASLFGASTLTASDLNNGDGADFKLTGLSYTFIPSVSETFTLGTAIDFAGAVSLTQAQLLTITGSDEGQFGLGLTDTDAITVTGVTATAGDFAQRNAIDLLDDNDTIDFEGTDAALNADHFAAVFNTNEVKATADDTITITAAEATTTVTATAATDVFVLTTTSADSFETINGLEVGDQLDVLAADGSEGAAYRQIAESSAGDVAEAGQWFFGTDTLTYWDANAGDGNGATATITLTGVQTLTAENGVFTVSDLVGP